MLNFLYGIIQHYNNLASLHVAESPSTTTLGLSLALSLSKQQPSVLWPILPLHTTFPAFPAALEEGAP